MRTSFLVFALLLPGCSASMGVEPVEADLRLPAGSWEIEREGIELAPSYQAIAVRSQHAYLGMDSTLDVVDLTTMAVDETFKDIPSTSLAFHKKNLVACGLVNGVYPQSELVNRLYGGSANANNVVITVLEPASGLVKTRTVLRLNEYLRTTGGIDDPLARVRCVVDKDTLFVSLSGGGAPREILELPIPSSSLDFTFPEELPEGTKRTRIPMVDGKSDLLDFAHTGEGMFTLAANAGGIEMFKNGEVTRLNRLDFQVRRLSYLGSKLFALNADGSIITVNPETGETIDNIVTEPSESFTIDESYAFSTYKHTLSITKLRR